MNISELITDRSLNVSDSEKYKLYYNVSDINRVWGAINHVRGLIATKINDGLSIKNLIINNNTVVNERLATSIMSYLRELIVYAGEYCVNYTEDDFPDDYMRFLTYEKANKIELCIKHIWENLL